MDTASKVIQIVLCVIAAGGLFLICKWSREEYIDYKLSCKAEKQEEKIHIDIRG